MIDDQIRCEWVNVSSGTGSPGLSRQSPESCKMAVIVVVVFVQFKLCSHHLPQPTSSGVWLECST